MKKIYIHSYFIVKLLLIIIFLFIPHASYANPLVGEWVSDRDRTMAEVRKVENVPKKANDYFESAFGKLHVKFTENKIYTEYDGVKDEFPYEVVRIKDDSITIKGWSNLIKKYHEITYHIEGDSIYSITSKYKFREYFKRVK